jgi:hypothetical protein
MRVRCREAKSRQRPRCPKELLDGVVNQRIELRNGDDPTIDQGGKFLELSKEYQPRLRRIARSKRPFSPSAAEQLQCRSERVRGAPSEGFGARPLLSGKSRRIGHYSPAQPQRGFG